MSGAAARTGDLEIKRVEEYYKNRGKEFCKKSNKTRKWRIRYKKLQDIEKAVLYKKPYIVVCKVSQINMYIEIEDNKILVYSKEYCRRVLWKGEHYYKYIEVSMSGAAARTGSYQEKDNREQLKIRT